MYSKIQTNQTVVLHLINSSHYTLSTCTAVCYLRGISTLHYIQQLEAPGLLISQLYAHYVIKCILASCCYATTCRSPSVRSYRGLMLRCNTDRAGKFTFGQLFGTESGTHKRQLPPTCVQPFPGRIIPAVLLVQNEMFTLSKMSEFLSSVL